MKKIGFWLWVAVLVINVRAHAFTTYAATNENRLWCFDSETPGTLAFDVPIMNIGNGETVIGLDFRPANAKLYAVTRDANSIGRIYTLNHIRGTMTGTATPASTISVALSSGSFGAYGVDFDPISDRLRLVNDDGQNLRIDVESGATVVDTPLAFAGNDTNAGTSPRVVAAAYDAAGRLFDYAFDIDTLVRQNPANDGILNSIGDSNVRAIGPVKLDIESGSGRALASLATSTTDYSLYHVDLVSGRFVIVGKIGFSNRDNLAIRGLAIAIGQTFVVNSSADSDDGSCDASSCTLREAITAADLNPGRDVINFNIPGAGLHKIALTKLFPPLTEAVVIDGTTQPGALPNTLLNGTNARLRIELDGTSAGSSSTPHGLNVTASDCTIKGLIINDFRHGAGISLSPRTRRGLVQGNFIGTDATGTVSRGNSSGVIVSSSESVVGGAAPAARNLISGNGSGNFNGFGIAIFGDSNNDLALANRIVNNIIGTDASGAVALSNDLSGVLIGNNAPGNIIGGLAVNEGNLIAGNGAHGVIVARVGGNNSVPSDNSSIQGNFIGTNGAGSAVIGNDGSGIFIENQSQTVIGGSGRASNTIAFNKRDGVTISGSTSSGNSIVNNRIFANAGLGINLQPAGEAPSTVTTNDNGDADSGPNGLQNFPVLNRVVVSNGVRTLEGTLHSTPNTFSDIDFYRSQNPDASGNGEGADYLRKMSVTTDNNGDATFSLSVDNLTPEQFVTATATDVISRDTSEFSRALAARVLGSVQFSLENLRVDESAGTITITATRSGDSSDGTFSVDYATSNGSATAGSDYTQTSGTLNFAVGQSSATFTVPILDDALEEGDETFGVALSNPNGGAILGAQSSATVTIVDNEARPIIVIEAAKSVREGDSGTTPLTFAVTASAPSTKTMRVTYRTGDQSANAPNDYAATQGTLVFAPGETTKNITVQVKGDTLVEGDEIFFVQLGAAENAFLQMSAFNGVATIIDDDASTLNLSVTPTTFSEAAGAGAATGTITRNTILGGPLTVTLLSSNRSKVLVPNTVVIPEGKTSVNFSLDAVDNALVDGPQSVSIVANSAGLGIGSVNLTVIDDDANEPPLAAGQNLSTPEDTPLTIALSGSDDKTAPADLNYRLATLPQNGALSGTAPNLIYTPNANFNGVDSFTFLANDGALDSAAATIALQVLAVNDAPVARAQQLNADNAMPLAITLSASDIEQEALNFSIVSGPQHGTLSGTAPNLIYTASAGFRGPDSFTFTANDGSAISQPATIDISVTGAAPVSAGHDVYNLILGASNQTQQRGVTLLSSGVFQISAPGVLANDSFAAGSALIVRALSNPKNGRFQLRNDGALFYLPSAGRVGVDEFAYVLSDGKTSATARVRLNVVDKRAPELRFDTPADRAIVRAINEIRGRTRDRNAGLQALTLQWRRFDGAYWNGSAWTTNSTELPLVLQGIDWKYSGKLPVSGTDGAKNLLDGRYDLRVTATDKSGNASSALNRLTVDNTAPQLQIVEPILSKGESADINSATPLLGLVEISGRARDINGVQRVELVLRRASDGAYWNGTAFTSAPARFPAQLAPSGDWKADRKTAVKIPALEQLKLGAYLITAYSYDRLGNVSKAEIAIQIVQTSAPAA